VAIGGGISTPLAIIVAVLLTRRKINAESSEIGAKATEVANRAAGVALENLRKELQAESRRRDEAVQAMDIEYRRRLDAIQETEERDRVIHRMALLIDAHSRWDKLVVEVLREHKIHGIPDPPTLDHAHFS
jgi:hypothetical protein